MSQRESHDPQHAALIGGSAGAFEIVRSMLAALPAQLDQPVIVVLHLPPTAGDTLVDVLDAQCPYPVKFAEDKEPIAPAVVYVAPPDYHLLIEAGYSFALSIDEPLHYSRPAIDVLFESAAEAYAARASAVLLSGASSDGSLGMAALHSRGAITIVQTPQCAEVELMPAAALARFTPNHVWSASQIIEQWPHLLRTRIPA